LWTWLTSKYISMQYGVYMNSYAAFGIQWENHINLNAAVGTSMVAKKLLYAI
jgi:hypothetical protein